MVSIRWLLAGKWSTDNARSRSASSCRLLDSLGETGALDKVSTVYNCLPGTWVIWYSKRESRSLNRRTLGRRLSRHLFPSSRTSCLWSVLIVIALPNIYSENFLHAQVIVRASFSIWVYQRSVSGMTLEAKATGCQELLFFCKRTAPSPNEDTSAKTLSLALRLNSVSTVGLVSSVLTLLNAWSWVWLHIQEFCVRSSSRRGWVNSSKLGKNFPNWFIIPMKRLSSETLLGGFIFKIAEVLSGSARIPLPSMTCPKNLMDGFPNWHLFCGTSRLDSMKYLL